MSCYVAPNVANFEEPKCFISTADTQLLANNMIRRLETIAEVAFKLLTGRFESIYDQFESFGNE